jgi:hypothetical protein
LPNDFKYLEYLEHATGNLYYQTQLKFWSILARFELKLLLDRDLSSTGSSDSQSLHGVDEIASSSDLPLSDFLGYSTAIKIYGKDGQHCGHLSNGCVGWS